jgi:hypothetical protein
MPLSNEDRAKVARFIAKHHVSVKEDVESEVAPYRGKSLEDTWQDIRSVCRAAAWILAKQPDRDKVVAGREPPHPSYRAIIARLRTRS